MAGGRNRVAGRARRGSLILVAILGAVLSMVFGNGVLTAASDTASGTGNEFHSGEMAPLPARDLRIAAADSGEADACTTAAYGDGPVDWTVKASLDIQASTLTSTNRVLCLKNAGSEAGVLTVIFDHFVDTEDGCGPGESVADPTGCATTDPGDLSSHLAYTFFIDPWAPSASSCQTFPGMLDDATPAVVSSLLGPGEVCAMELNIYPGNDTSMSDEDILRIIQTDSLTFWISATLEDA